MKRALIHASTAASAFLTLYAAAPAYADNTCPELIAAAEQRRQIPHGLLMAIAITESGLNGRPNPFAMNIAGKAHHARDTQEMAQIISSNYQRGVTSIDVGCMQINLKYHAKHFRSPTELLHSPTNVEYGASYLIKLAAKKGSWREGVMDYHNKDNPARRVWYGCLVWNNYLRINHATSGFLPCGKSPKGSSVASNARAINTKPLVIAGYNAPQPGNLRVSLTAQNTQYQPQATTGGLPLVHSQPSAVVAAHSVPSGNPLLPPAAQTSEANITEQGRARGRIEIAGADRDLADITTSADPRASAFQAVRPLERTSYGNDAPSDLNVIETTRSHGGFARLGPAG